MAVMKPPQAPGAGSSARVAASCSDPTALSAEALSAEELSTGFMLSQTLASSAFASILAIEGSTFFISTALWLEESAV